MKSRRAGKALGLRQVAAAGLIAISTLLAATLPASPASAAKLFPMCTTVKFGLLCNNTHGSGIYVTYVYASLTNSAWMCNKEFNVRGTLNSGASFDRVGLSKCGFGEVYYRFDINMNFRAGTYLCVRVKEYGGQNPWEPYQACAQIRA